MKKKHSYVFKKQVLKKQVLCEQDAVGFILEELKGKSLPEQLHKCGIRFVIVDNKDPDYGSVNSMNAPKARELFAPIRGFRAKDFSPRQDNLFVGLNVRKHRKNFKHNYLVRECETLAHEMAHTKQMDAKNCHRRGYFELGNLSVELSRTGDESFCDSLAEAWLVQGSNFIEAKQFIEVHRRHRDFSRIFPTHIATFTR